MFYAKRPELFIDLLYEMALALGYDFDKTQIAKEAYSTQYQEDVEKDSEIIRKQLVRILTGQAAFPMNVVDVPIDADFAKNQAEYMKLSAQYLREGKPFPVEVVVPGKVVAMRPAADPQTQKPEGTTGG